MLQAILLKAINRLFKMLKSFLMFLIYSRSENGRYNERFDYLTDMRLCMDHRESSK